MPRLNLERGFRRLAALLSVGGLGVGLLVMRYLYVRGQLGDVWISYLIILALWPWVVLFSVRWIVRGFRN